MLAYFLTEKNSWKNKYIFFAFFKVLDLNLIIFKKETFFVSIMVTFINILACLTLKN